MCTRLDEGELMSSVGCCVWGGGGGRGEENREIIEDDEAYRLTLKNVSEKF